MKQEDVAIFYFVGKRIELWNLISSIEAARPHSPLSDRLKLARGIESGPESWLTADCLWEIDWIIGR